MTRQIFRVNIFYQKISYYGKMNEILSDIFGAKYSRMADIETNTIVVLLLYFRKMNNRPFSKFQEMEPSLRIQIELYFIQS